jgi:hypothetical protein
MEQASTTNTGVDEANTGKGKRFVYDQQQTTPRSTHALGQLQAVHRQTRPHITTCCTIDEKVHEAHAAGLHEQLTQAVQVLVEGVGQQGQEVGAVVRPVTHTPFTHTVHTQTRQHNKSHIATANTHGRQSVSESVSQYTGKGPITPTGRGCMQRNRMRTRQRCDTRVQLTSAFGRSQRTCTPAAPAKRHHAERTCHATHQTCTAGSHSVGNPEAKVYHGGASCLKPRTLGS